MIKIREKGLKTLGMALLLIVFSANHREQEFIPDLKERLEEFNSVFHNEKAYLFTDRYIYHAGEIIWFSGYVLSADAANESFSEDFYIKMFDSNGNEIFFRRYPLVNRMVSGKLQLPKSLIPGKYKILAYTGWMKNQPIEDVYSKEILISGFIDKRLSASVIFDRMIYSPGDTFAAVININDHEGLPIQISEFTWSLETFSRQLARGTGITDISGNAKISETVPESKNEIITLSIALKKRNTAGRYSVYVPVLNSAPEISFFPEGGQLVKGFENTVFIEARDNNGMPLSIQGGLYDSDDNLIDTIVTGFDGTGSFVYKPATGISYLRIHDPCKSDEFYPLPGVSAGGTALKLNSVDMDSAFLSVMTTERDSLFVVAVAGGNIAWNNSILTDSCFNFSIPVKNYNGDLIQVTVFNIQGEPLSERVIKVPEANILNMYPNRRNFLKRQRVTITLEYKGDEDYLDLALTVAPRNMSEYQGMHTLTQYAVQGPDDVIATYHNQGKGLFIEPRLKPVDWAKLLENEGAEPYRNQDGLSGMVIDKKDNASQLAKVRVTHIPGYRSYETQTDNTGQFRVLFGQDIIDFNYLNIEAYDASGRINLTSAVDYNFSEKLKQNIEQGDSSTVNEKLRDLLAYGDPDIIYALRYSPAKLRNLEKTSNRKYNPYSYREFNNVLDIIRDIRDYDIVDGRLVFRDAEKDLNKNAFSKASIIVINGVLWGDRIDILNSISPLDITNLVISSSPSDIHRYTQLDFGSVIEITTIQGMYRYRQRPFQTIKDLTSPRMDFYSPDYSVETNTAPDSRKTLYWNPSIRLIPGNPVTVSFFTSDISGIFSIRAEGMDASGTPVTVSERITIE